ncbi:MAG: zinc dependent phospholipase C family protein [Negativicutes bacterium]|nr:zinc dependent phospholipase C family protein [Negativicutes bacterium]
MASSMMHLYAGRKVSMNWLPPQNKAQFYLGCIVPDSVNLQGFASKEKRWAAHFRHADLQIWAEQAARFYENSSGDEDPDFLLGYVVHVFTDIAWDAGAHNYVWRAMPKLQLPAVSELGAGWDDCFRFDHQQLKAAWWLQEVRPLLKTAAVKPINGLSKEWMEAFRQQIIAGGTERDNRLCNPPALVTDLLVDQLARQTEQLCRKMIRRSRLPASGASGDCRAAEGAGLPPAKTTGR